MDHPSGKSTTEIKKELNSEEISGAIADLENAAITKLLNVIDDFFEIDKAELPDAMKECWQAIKKEQTDIVHDEKNTGINKLINEIDGFLDITRKELPDAVPEKCWQPTDKPNCLVKIKMRRGIINIAKQKLKDYEKRHGRVQALWVDPFFFTILWEPDDVLTIKMACSELNMPCIKSLT